MKYDTDELEKLGQILETYVNGGRKTDKPKINKLLQTLQVTKEEIVDVFRTITMYGVVISREDVACLTLPNSYFVGYKSIDTSRLKKIYTSEILDFYGTLKLEPKEYKKLIATVKKDLKKIDQKDLIEGYEYHGPDEHYFLLMKENAAMATAMEYEDLHDFDCWQPGEESAKQS